MMSLILHLHSTGRFLIIEVSDTMGQVSSVGVSQVSEALSMSRWLWSLLPAGREWRRWSPHGRLSPISCDSAMSVSVQPQLGLARKLNLQSPVVCALLAAWH